MNVYKIYNTFLINYNKIMLKIFFILTQTLRMQNKNVIIKNFNLHHFH